MAAAVPPLAPMMAGPPTWSKLFVAADRVFMEPQVDFRVLAASLFTSNDAPNKLLAKLEAFAQRLPVILAMVSDEEPDRIALLKNPRHFADSLANPSPIDSMIYGFMGTNGWNLAAVHIPASAFENSVPYNILDDATTIQMGLDSLPPDQYFHVYVAVGTQNTMKSAWKRCLVMPMEWYQEVAHCYPDGIDVKEFHDQFLTPVTLADCPALNDVFTWWRHAASQSARTAVRVQSGLQVATSQALMPATQAQWEVWA